MFYLSENFLWLELIFDPHELSSEQRWLALEIDQDLYTGTQFFILVLLQEHVVASTTEREQKKVSETIYQVIDEYFHQRII